jgi:hypothetical protein
MTNRLITVLSAMARRMDESLRRVTDGESPPSILEVAILVLLGMAFGFGFLAFSVHAVMTLFVVGLGAVWGLVLGLLMDRLRQQYAA